MRVRRVLGWMLGLALAIPLVLILIAYGLTATEAGSRWLLDRAVTFSGETNIEVAQIRGRLLDHLELSELVVEVAGTRIEVSEIDIDWSPAALLGGKLQIGRLGLAGVDVTPPPASPW